MQYTSAVSRLALIALGLLVVAGPAHSDQVVNLLPNGGGEMVGESGKDPAEWFAAMVPADGLAMSRDTEHARAGEACLSISNEAEYKEPVSNNWAQRLRYVPAGRVVRVRGYIRTEAAEAANICVQCWSLNGATLIGFASTPVIKGTTDWKRVTSDRLVVPQDTEQLIVRAALTGKGRAYFDGVSLEIVGPKAPADPGLAAVVKGRILRKLPLVKDSMILSYMPEWEHGNVDNLGVANNAGGVRTLVAWRDPPAARDRPNQRFILAMYSHETRLHGDPGDVQAYEILEDWNELVSWKEQPRVATRPALKFKMEPGKGWKFFDMTSLIEKRTEAEKLRGILLRFEREDIDTEKRGSSGYGFTSREGIGEHESYRPVLLVVDPDQPALPETKAEESQPVERSCLTTEQLLKYVEYLASSPDVKIRSVPGEATAYHHAMHHSNEAVTKNQNRQLDPAAAHVHMHMLQIPAYERLVAAYPLTPEGVKAMSGLLSWTYLQAGLAKDAERIALVASRLAKDTELAALTEINLASIEAQVGKHDAAEARLRGILNRKLPASESRMTSDILLVAPLKLADLLQEWHRYDESEPLYDEIVKRGLEWDRKHAEQPIGQSYAKAAYRGRLQTVMDRNEDVEASLKKLMKEIEERVPAVARELRGEFSMVGRPLPEDEPYRGSDEETQ